MTWPLVTVISVHPEPDDVRSRRYQVITMVTVPTRKRIDLQRQSAVAVASRAAATNAAGNQRYRRRSATRKNQSQTISGNFCGYTGRSQAYKYEQKIIQYSTQLFCNKTRPGQTCTQFRFPTVYIFILKTFEIVFSFLRSSYQ